MYISPSKTVYFLGNIIRTHKVLFYSTAQQRLLAITGFISQVLNLLPAFFYRNKDN